jgi:hypothetical protein
MRRAVGRARKLVLLGLLLPIGAIGCARQPPPMAAEQLQIKINLLCTTCDDFLQCTPSGRSTESEFQLYRLREKSFFAQIATISDYLIQWIHPKTNDRRPLTVYREESGVSRVLVADATATVDLVTALITLPDSTIDMRDGNWLIAGESAGHCQAMLRRDGYRWLRSLLNKPLPTRAAP